MKHSALFLPLAVLTAAPSVADMVNRPVVMPIFRRVFDFNVPAGFVPQPLQRDATQILVEIVPANETVETWTQLITVRGFRGLGASPMSTRDLATKLFEPKKCGKSASLTVGPEETVFGPLRRTIVTIGCGRSPGGSFPGDKAGGGEQDFIYLFRDDQHLYSLQYAVRGTGFDTPRIDPATAGAVLARQFGEVHLCASAEQPGCERAILSARLMGAPL